MGLLILESSDISDTNTKNICIILLTGCFDMICGVTNTKNICIILLTGCFDMICGVTNTGKF